MPVFKRILELERDAKAPAPLGVVRGVLATDGEASDGHIISIAGGEVSPGMPFLYGHDQFSGDRDLGSWVAFRKITSRKPGESKIIGDAEIELEGAGASRDWREDVAVKVSKGRLRGLSIRWEPIDSPVPRVNLSKDHPAYIDAEKERGNVKRWGLWFPTWRGVEGSLVAVGSDRDCLTEAARGDSPVAAMYRSALVDHDEHQAELEREIEARVASLELFLAPGKVPAAPAAARSSRTAPREAIDALLERIWTTRAKARLGPEFLEELEQRAVDAARRMIGRT